MRYMQKGMTAGLFAAAVTAGLMLVNAEVGFFPQLDLIGLIATATGAGVAAAWLIHFVFGGLLGGLFAWLDPDLPGDNLRQRGMIFASALWFFAVALLLPLGGAGFFGFDYGLLLPLALLGLHLVFGAVMGSTYGWLLLQSVPLRYRQAREI